MILDSGNRTEFDSGAVRDIQEGKGRCDLLPLDTIATFYYRLLGRKDGVVAILNDIHQFMQTGKTSYLYDALYAYLGTTYETVANEFLAVAKHFEDGAKKYGERNWEKGIPVSRYIDSALRHYFKRLRGDTDEHHDRAFVWNILCAIWTCEHKPGLNEYKKSGEWIEFTKDDEEAAKETPHHFFKMRGV